MKIETKGITNFNHVQQNRNNHQLEKTRASTISNKSNVTALSSTHLSISENTSSIMQHNETIAMLQMLKGSVSALQEHSSTLKDLSRRYEISSKEQATLESKFSEVSEQMMDIIDNTVYNGQQLFSHGQAFATFEGQTLVALEELSAIDALEVTNRQGVVDFSEQLKHVLGDIQNATQFVSTSMANIFAALSDQSGDISQEALLASATTENTLPKGLRDAHGLENLRYKIESLLGE